MEMIYTEKDLVIPALQIIAEAENGLTTSELIKALEDKLKPEGDDAKILFGRKDSRFSQKVRNLISHKTLYPQYVEYVSQTHMLKINQNGLSFLENYEENIYIPEQILIDEKESLFDGQESLQSIDEEMEDTDDEDRYVSVENINFSVYELKRKYDRTEADKINGHTPKNGLILDESFQRTGSVWTRAQKSQLIESVLMDIPLPFIYLAEAENGNLVVIDGRQRLTALFDFLENKFSLSKIPFFPDLNGKKVKQLTGDLEALKTKIEDTHLYVIKIKSTTPEKLKLQIFSRVNRNGTPLNSQEIRHALHQGASTKMLEFISNEFDILKRTRMKDRYLVLRYIALRLYVLNKLFNYKTKRNVEYKDINSFLADAMDAINTFTEKQIQEIITDFETVYNKAKLLLGDKAFKLNPNSPINMIWFEETLLILTLYGDKINSENMEFILKKLQDIDKERVNDDGETPFEQNIKYHRDSKENYAERIRWIRGLEAII